MSTVAAATNTRPLGPVGTTIETKLRQGLEPVRLVVIDDSHKHAGHAAMKGNTAGETHFSVEVVSKAFDGKNLVSRHREVYQLLKEEIQTSVHALSIKAKTPEEWEKAHPTDSTATTTSS